MGARDVQAAAPRDEKAERGDTAIAAVPLAAVPTDAVPQAESPALAPRSLPVALRLRPVGTGASPRKVPPLESWQREQLADVRKVGIFP